MLKLLKDLRIGNITKYYITDKGVNQMQIPDEVRKCVFFIYCPTEQGSKLVGTGFFIAENIEKTDLSFYYCVTAKHIIEKAQSFSIDNTILLRINLKSGESAYVSTNINNWVFHPENFLDDVAILSYLPSKDFDFKAYPLKSIVNTKVIEEEKISIGDETFITGLFSKHHGTMKNIPIIRVGNIAAMTEEQITINEGSIDAYLIETRSFGGLSGSPVFVNLGLHRIIDGSYKISTGGFRFYLLGLIRGHWDWKEEDYDFLIKEEINIEVVNMGIAIVTPATKILETINHPILLERKEKSMEKIRKRNLPTEDATS